MKPIYSSEDPHEINAMKMRLESNGIPVFVGNDHTARNLPHLGGHTKRTLFVYLAEHHDDALSLIQDEDHVVDHPVDVAAFYEEVERSNHTTRGWLSGNAIIILIVSAMLLFILFMST